MATIEYISKRIEGKEKEIGKLESKLARIQKAQATNWEVNPYYYHESDLKWTMRDLETARTALEKLHTDLVKANEKAASRNIPAITQFLDGWKARMTAYYMKAIDECHEMQSAVQNAYNAYTTASTEETYHQSKDAYEAIYAEYKLNRCGRYEIREVDDPRYNYHTHQWEHRMVKKEVKVEDGKWEYASEFLSSSKEEDIQKLEKVLTDEYNRKYDFIIERTNELIGQITDATQLSIGAKDDLNGFIIGAKGTVKVQTIGAGGYNIQCFHFRTLINKI